MRCLELVWQGGKLALFTMTGWLAVHGAVLAQGPEKKVDGNAGSYVLPYAVVILGIALGMLCVCRSSGRRDRARPEQYDETRVNVTE